MESGEVALSIGIALAFFVLGLAGGFWIQHHFTSHRLKIRLRLVEHTSSPPGSRVELRVRHRSGLSLHRGRDSVGRNPRIDFANFTVLDTEDHPVYSVHPARKCSVPLFLVNGGSSAWINLNYMDRRATARIFFVVTGTPPQLSKSSVYFFPGNIPNARVRAGGSLLPRRKRHWLSE